MKYSLVILLFLNIHVSHSMRLYKSNDYNETKKKFNINIPRFNHDRIIYDIKNIQPPTSPPPASPPLASPPTPIPSPQISSPISVDKTLNNKANITIINKRLNIDDGIDGELNTTGYLNLYFNDKVFRVPIYRDIQIHYNLSDIYDDIYNTVIRAIFDNITHVVKNNNDYIQNIENIDKSRNFSFKLRRLLFLREGEL